MITCPHQTGAAPDLRCTRPGANCVTCCLVCGLAHERREEGKLGPYTAPACKRRCEKVEE
jgi:hypothetical protein